MNKKSISAGIVALLGTLVSGCDTRPNVITIADDTINKRSIVLIEEHSYLGVMDISKGSSYLCIGRDDGTFETATAYPVGDITKVYKTKDSVYAWDGKIIRNITEQYNNKK